SQHVQLGSRPGSPVTSAAAVEAFPVVIVHRDEPERCVRTVRAFLSQGVRVQVTVVDNGSASDAVRHLERELPGADIATPGGILVAAERDTGWEDAGHPHGTLMVAARACLTDVGLFDERYFAYCEEADLGERARRAGWEVGVVWDALVANPSMSGGSAAVEY